MQFIRRSLVQVGLVVLNFRNISSSVLNSRLTSGQANRQLKSRIGSETSFNQKLAKKMYFDKNPLLSIVADKLLVRDYVKNRIGSEYLSRIFYESSEPETIPWEALPDSFVIKVNHASGGVILVCACDLSHDILPFRLIGNVWPKFLISKKELGNKRALLRILRHWLKHSYFFFPNKFPEHAYNAIEPRIFIEEFLSSGHYEVPLDYKFFCFHGKCKIIQVDSSRFGKHTRDLFDLEWNLLPFAYTYPNSETKPNIPVNFDNMVTIAEKLSNGFDFIRVDLYNLDGRIVFGELTNYPEGGTGKFLPAEWDNFLGSFW